MRGSFTHFLNSRQKHASCCSSAPTRTSRWRRARARRGSRAGAWRHPSRHQSARRARPASSCGAHVREVMRPGPASAPRGSRPSCRAGRRWWMGAVAGDLRDGERLPGPGVRGRHRDTAADAAVGAHGAYFAHASDDPDGGSGPFPRRVSCRSHLPHRHRRRRVRSGQRAVSASSSAAGVLAASSSSLSSSREILEEARRRCHDDAAARDVDLRHDRLDERHQHLVGRAPVGTMSRSWAGKWSTRATRPTTSPSRTTSSPTSW